MPNIPNRMIGPDPNGFKEIVALLSNIEDRISQSKRQEQFLSSHSVLNIL
jgi:hypothetical protein